MRNLKKLLALVLAMVMAFSLMLTASAANGDYDKYTDKETITEEFQTAVNVLSGLDVLKGDGPDDAKTFRPADTLTRAEAAVIVYRVATGDVKDQQTDLYKDYNHFADVKSDDWFAGYVGFCQNAGVIKGTTPTTFSPYEKVSGYQLLAMLLRVIGYGKNNEFTGSTWQVNTAAMAESLHLTDTVKKANFVDTLNKNARRDVVAELTFRSMILPATVTYTPALSYSEYKTIGGTEKNDTQGYKIFGLVSRPSLQADKWGRPNDTWFCDSIKGATKYGYDKGVDTVVAEITWKPDVTEHVAKTECDLVHENTDWSKDKDVTVTSRYLNGVKSTATYLTEGNDNSIEALGTTKVMGAQGRLLEIYDMSKSYNYGQVGAETGSRVVEIDTYLARVDRVTAAGTDKNGHPTKATVDLSVYPGYSAANETRRHNVNAVGSTHTNAAAVHAVWDFDGVEAEGFGVGEYVLVYVNQDKNGGAPSTSALKNKPAAISDIVKSDIKAGGYVNSWTNGSLDQPHTTTVGSTVYKDSDKFCLNFRQQNIPYSVAMDRYENAIGLVNPTQYLAIEGIRWIHDGSLYGGKALADVVLANGEKVEGITIADVNNITATNSFDTYGRVATSTVSDYFTNNRQYYYHIYSYAVKEDGTYSLKADLPATTNNTAPNFNGANNERFGITDTNTDVRRAWGLGTAPNVTANNAGNANHYARYGTAGAATGKNILDIEGARIAQGEATIWGDNNGTTNNQVATNNTVFALLNADRQTYTIYTGKDNVPSMTDADICVLTDASGYAQFVVVSEYKLAGNHFQGYVGKLSPVTSKVIGGQSRSGYEVYRMGDTTPTIVYTQAGHWAAVQQTGFYTFDVDASGMTTTAATAVPGSVGTTDTLADVDTDPNVMTDWNVTGVNMPLGTSNCEEQYVLVRTRVEAEPNATSIQTRNYYLVGNTNAKFVPATSAATNDYDVRNGYTWIPAAIGTNGVAPIDFNIGDAKIIVIEKQVATDGEISNQASVVRAGTVSDINLNSLVWVYYKDRTVNNLTVHDADAVYVLNVPVDTTSKTTNVKVTTDSNFMTNTATLSRGAIVANGLTGYMATNTIWGDETDALKAAIADPNYVSLSNIQSSVVLNGGQTGRAFTVTPLTTLDATAVVGAVSVNPTPGNGTAGVGMKIYTGATTLPTTAAAARTAVSTTDAVGGTVGLYSGANACTYISRAVPSVGDRFLIVQSITNGTNVDYVYTVVLVTP